MLPAAAAQRGQRYTHLIAGEPDLSAVVVREAKVSSRSQQGKIAELEARIEHLEKALDMD